MSYEFDCLESASEEFKRRFGFEIPVSGPIGRIDYLSLLSLLNITEIKDMEDRSRLDYLFLLDLFNAQEKELIALVTLGRNLKGSMRFMNRRGISDNEDECDCECHEPGKRIMHCAPCCDTCLDCGKNIRNGMMDIHKECRCSGMKPPIPVSGEPYGTAR